VAASRQPDQERVPNGGWAGPVTRLTVRETPTGALNLNVDGKRLVGPLQGFGQLWQKTYRVALIGAAVTPAEVIAEWKANFSSFWPAGSRFYAPLTGIAPGEVALINLPLVPRGTPLSTGVAVIYVDNLSFSFMTPEGHMFAGMITFSAHEREGATIAQAQVLIRANDPLWELVSRIYMFRKEDRFWRETLRALARHFGVEAEVQTVRLCVDPRLQWAEAKNIWHNAAIRSSLYAAAAPLRWTRAVLSRRPPDR
jgi:hypothetical protein